MSNEELIETLTRFEKERVNELPEKARKLFYAIMSIADERDKLLRKLNNIKELVDRLNNEPITKHNIERMIVLAKIKEALR